MASLQVGNGLAVDMANMDYSVFFFGEPTVATKKRYVLDFGTGEVVDFRGEDFKYNKNGQPIGGELEGFSFFNNGTKVFQIADISVSVKAFVSAAETTTQADDLKITSIMFEGKDRLIGGALADGLMGFKGNDVLYGAGGADVLAGGAGKDKYVYLDTSESTLASIDTISGFTHGDKIGLATIADYEFIGQAAFSGTGPEIAYTVLNGDTYIIADTDGDMNTDLAIKIDGAITLTEADFIL